MLMSNPSQTGARKDRRNFIRLLGGGIVVSSLSSLTACSDDFPAEAVEAWQGPGDEPDLRRWALAYAILAPNSHNRQPWLVDLREPNTITLYVDRSRMLPMTDPWFRQIVVSQGTFLESLVVALRERGLSPEVQLFPQGEFKPHEVDDRPVARVSWAGDAAPVDSPAAPASVLSAVSAVSAVSAASLLDLATGKDPLFAQLLRRHTAKIDYDTTRPVAPATLDALRSVLNDPEVAVAGVKFGGTVDAARLEPLRTLCWESARTELLTPRTVMESVQLTRIGPAEIAQHRDGISVNSMLPRLAAMVGAFDRSNPPAEGSTAYKQMMGRFEGHSRTAMGFVWLSTPHGPPRGSRHHPQCRGAGRACLPAPATQGDRAGPANPPHEPGPAGISRDEALVRPPARPAAGPARKPGDGADVLPHWLLCAAAAHAPAGVAGVFKDVSGGACAQLRGLVWLAGSSAGGLSWRCGLASLMGLSTRLPGQQGRQPF